MINYKELFIKLYYLKNKYKLMTTYSFVENKNMEFHILFEIKLI